MATLMTKRNITLAIIAIFAIAVVASAAAFWLAPSSSLPVPSGRADSLKGDVNSEGGRMVPETTNLKPGETFFCRTQTLENLGTKPITLRSVEPLQLPPGINFAGAIHFKADEHHPHNQLSWSAAGNNPPADPRKAKTKLQFDGTVLHPGGVMPDELMLGFTIGKDASYPIRVRDIIVHYDREGIPLKQTIRFACDILAP